MEEMIGRDKEDEKGAIDLYKQIIKKTLDRGNQTTNRLFRQILAGAEDYQDTFVCLLEKI